MTTFTLTDLYFVDVAEKRQNAQTLFAIMGEELAGTPAITTHLDKLNHLSKNLRDSMESLVMFSLCTACGQQPGGGCCSAFMAGETDAMQLLMNMLLGIEVASQRQDDFECCYLGKGGCLFTLKPFFCLNYNCQQITQGNTSSTLAPYLRATGLLLQEQNRLEQFILDLLRRRGIITTS